MDDPIEVPALTGVPNPDEQISDNSSILSRLKSQHKIVVEEKTADFDIPGYDGFLFARYRVLDSSELDDIRRRVRQETKNPSEQITNASLDTLVTACEEFWIRDEGQVGRERPLREVAKEESPVRYNQALAESVGFADILPDPPTARSCVIGLFGGNALAAQAHSAMISQWMLRINLGVDQQLGGI